MKKNDILTVSLNKPASLCILQFCSKRITGDSKAVKRPTVTPFVCYIDVPSHGVALPGTAHRSVSTGRLSPQNSRPSPSPPSLLSTDQAACADTWSQLDSRACCSTPPPGCLASVWDCLGPSRNCQPSVWLPASVSGASDRCAPLPSCLL